MKEDDLSCSLRKILHLLIALVVYPSLLGLSFFSLGQHKTSSIPTELSGAGASFRESPEKGLFSSEDILHFKLKTNYKELLKDRGEESSYHQAFISYQDETGATVTEELKVRVRGNRRRDPAVCRFPPILLNFKRSTVESTVFGKVNKVKMVTHCIGDEYVLREYLIYRLYNIITDRSFKVRLCLVSYEDLQGKRKPEARYAFLIEDDDKMAERNGGVIVPEELIVRMNRTDSVSMAMLALFQFMIGNTDWSVPYRHNIDVLNIDSVYIAVPFDFDYSGMVNAPYAQPPPELGIESVRQRLFRGYSFDESVYREIITYYNALKSDLYRVYTGCEVLDKKSRKSSIKYLDSFYKILNDPKDFKREIVAMGDHNSRYKITVKGLK